MGETSAKLEKNHLHWERTPNNIKKTNMLCFAADIKVKREPNWIVDEHIFLEILTSNQGFFIGDEIWNVTS